jgi:hypothetical protein
MPFPDSTSSASLDSDPLVAVVDLDSDGYSDLVPQHADSGETAAWYLSAPTVRFGAILNPSSVGARVQDCGPR